MPPPLNGSEEPGDVQDIRLVFDTIPTLAWSATAWHRPPGSWLGALTTGSFAARCIQKGCRTRSLGCS